MGKFALMMYRRHRAADLVPAVRVRWPPDASAPDDCRLQSGWPSAIALEKKPSYHRGLELRECIAQVEVEGIPKAFREYVRWKTI
jgi:hypothetical protein